MTQCIVCHSNQVEEFLDLGCTALANKFLTTEELAVPERIFPLKVGFCHSCTHVQLTERAPVGEMFDHYLYISSVSATLTAHLHDLARIVSQRFKLGPSDLVIDIGSNDGTLLSAFKSYGTRVLGVDPAKNLAELALQRGVKTYSAYFGRSTAAEIRTCWGRASVITATNTFPHIPDLGDFLKGIEEVMAPEGVMVIEAHYLADLLDACAFDTIYHEHVSYWALRPMVWLFSDHGFTVVDAERLPLHHGQLRVFVQRQGHGRPSPSVTAILKQETEKKMDRFETYQRFGQRVQQVKQDLRRTFADLSRQGKRVVGYGAPAKGNTLLSFLALDPRDVEYIADASTLKQGRYTPGTHIPVVSPTRLLADQPDYALLLAWNFADEILEQQAEYRGRGGRFIIPLPHPVIV